MRRSDNCGRTLSIFFTAGLLLAALWLVACGRNQPVAANVPTVMATAESVAQATEEPSPTLAPTNTPAPPTATATSSPSPTPTETPTPTLTPTPVFLLAPADFGTDRNPLTGELVEDPTVLQRRPLAVKIANNPPEYTRPQAGLSQADLVFEHTTEGPITRFSAIFYGQTPPDIGPIRSARLIDLEIPAMLDAALVFSGAHPEVSRRLFSSDIRPRILRSNEPGYYRTGEDKPWEHTLHADPTGLWQALDARDINEAPELTAYLSFTSTPPEGGEPASAVHVEYRDWTYVDWEYDADSGRYWRWTDGEEHLDANTDEQISAANVIVVHAVHILDESICTYAGDDGACAASPIQIQIWGWGRAQILRDGRVYNVTWRRENRSDMLTFYDDEDNPLPLQIGNTWFQIVPWHYTDAVSTTP